MCDFMLVLVCTIVSLKRSAWLIDMEPLYMHVQVGIDLIGTLKESTQGNKYIVTMTD